MAKSVDAAVLKTVGEIREGSSPFMLTKIYPQGVTKLINLQREVWEGWTVQDFIDELSDQIGMIMCGESWQEPFKTEEELARFIKDNQPYYKKDDPGS